MPGPAVLASPRGCRGSLTAQEALAAVNRPALSRLERHRGFPAALGACSHGLRFGKTRPRRSLPFSLASLAALGLVLEIFVMEEVLFSRCENEICFAVYTLEDAIQIGRAHV